MIHREVFFFRIIQEQENGYVGVTFFFPWRYNYAHLVFDMLVPKSDINSAHISEILIHL